MKNNTGNMGMLFMVHVSMKNIANDELIKNKLLMVCDKSSGIEDKLKWIFDASKFSSLRILSAEKIRQKIHILSTVTTQDDVQPHASISAKDSYNPKLYAVGVSTLIHAGDQNHALRKVGRALTEKGTAIKSSGTPTLSNDSTINVEEVPVSSGFSKARNVSSEINTAKFVRG
jgi:hypothetical protein